MRTLGSLRLGRNTARLLRWCLGLGTLTWLVLFLDTGGITSSLSKASWPLALPAVLGLVAVQFLGAAMWKLLSDRLSGTRFSWAFAMRAYYAAQAVGSLTPSNVGADVYRIYAVSGDGNSWMEPAVPIIAQRLLSYLALVGLAGAAAFVVPLPAGMYIALAALTGALVAGTGALWFLARKISDEGSLVRWAMRRFGVSDRLMEVDRSRLAAALGGGLILALAFHVIAVLITYVLVLSLGLQDHRLQVLAALLLARLTIIIPFSINGLGFQEGALALLFPAIGIPAEQALAVSLLGRLALVLTISLGALSLLWGRAAQYDDERLSAAHSRRRKPYPLLPR